MTKMFNTHKVFLLNSDTLKKISESIKWCNVL